MTKQRGVFLTIMILFLIVGDIQIPYYIMNPDALKTIYREIPSWYVPYVILGLASNIAIIVGMWQMKKWSAYVLIGYFASKLAVDFVYILPQQQMMVFLTTVAGAGLWLWAVRRKWSLFS